MMWCFVRRVLRYARVRRYNIKTVKVNLQLENSRGQECSSIGKLFSFSWHSASMVNLQVTSFYYDDDVMSLVLPIASLYFTSEMLLFLRLNLQDYAAQRLSSALN